MKEQIINGINYRLNEDTLTAEVIQDHDNDYNGDIVIPKKVEFEKLSYCVTSIGDWAFYDCRGLVSVTLGNTVTSIGEMAFGDCVKLVEIINRSSLDVSANSNAHGGVARHAKEVHNGTSTKIVLSDNYLFYTHGGVNWLLGYVGEDAELRLPESYGGQKYDIYQYAFYKNTHVTEISIQNNTTSIGNGAFYGCENLMMITIPDSVTSIGSSAFSQCTNLNSIIIPNGVTSIESWLFNGCSNLTNIMIPASVTRVGSWVFENCDNLVSITVDGKNQVYKSEQGVLYTKDGQELIKYPAGKTNESFTCY